MWKKLSDIREAGDEVRNDRFKKKKKEMTGHMFFQAIIDGFCFD